MWGEVAIIHNHLNARTATFIKLKMFFFPIRFLNSRTIYGLVKQMQSCDTPIVFKFHLFWIFRFGLSDAYQNLHMMWNRSWATSANAIGNKWFSFAQRFITLTTTWTISRQHFVLVEKYLWQTSCDFMNGSPLFIVAGKITELENWYR